MTGVQQTGPAVDTKTKSAVVDLAILTRTDRTRPTVALELARARRAHVASDRRVRRRVLLIDFGRRRARRHRRGPDELTRPVHVDQTWPHLEQGSPYRSNAPLHEGDAVRLALPIVFTSDYVHSLPGRSKTWGQHGLRHRCAQESPAARRRCPTTLRINEVPCWLYPAPRRKGVFCRRAA